MAVGKLEAWVGASALETDRRMPSRLEGWLVHYVTVARQIQRCLWCAALTGFVFDSSCSDVANSNLRLNIKIPDR